MNNAIGAIGAACIVMLGLLLSIYLKLYSIEKHIERQEKHGVKSEESQNG